MYNHPPGLEILDPAPGVYVAENVRLFSYLEPTFFFMHGNISRFGFCTLTIVNQGNKDALRLGEKSFHQANYRLLVNIDGEVGRPSRFWAMSTTDRLYRPSTPVISIKEGKKVSGLQSITALDIN